MHYFTTIGGLVVVTHATSKLTNLIHLARESFWEDQILWKEHAGITSPSIPSKQ
jgi:hypothetical protein